MLLLGFWNRVGESDFPAHTMGYTGHIKFDTVFQIRFEFHMYPTALSAPNPESRPHHTRQPATAYGV